MKKVIGVLSTLAIIGGLLGACADAEVKQVSNSGSEQKKEKKEEKKTEFKVGETVSVDGMEVTVNKVSWGKPAEYSAAEKGKVLRIEVTAKNNSANNGFIDSTEFQVYAGDTKYEEYFGNDDANLGGGELKKGKTMPLILEFDVPEAESYEIFYEPSFTLSENAEIKYIVTKAEIK